MSSFQSEDELFQDGHFGVALFELFEDGVEVESRHHMRFRLLGNQVRVVLHYADDVTQKRRKRSL